jgi:hypothetical protein
MSMPMLHVRVHAACTCPCCMFMSICMSLFMLHVLVHDACPCSCCMSRYMLHVHVGMRVHVRAAWIWTETRHGHRLLLVC